MSTETTDISVEQLLAKLDRGEKVALLDVRNDEEYHQWKIEARRPIEYTHIPYFDFIEDEISAVGKSPSGPGEVVVVCAKGGSSAMVAELLRHSGITAKNLSGGMVGYGEYLDPIRVQLESAERDRFEMWQMNRRGKGCLSYMIVSEGKAAVIDPSRNIGVYESLARRAKARITHVFETHIHADHVSGGPRLAATHGAEYCVHASTDFELKLPAASLRDSQRIVVGGVTIEVLMTPGHTPDSVCYLVDNRYLVSGDTLFTSSVGRPDLGGHAMEWARDLYHTIFEKLSRLPDDVEVFPAHYSAASDINAVGTVSARLRDLRERLPEFQMREQEFLNVMVQAIKAPPPSYQEIVRTNLGAASPDLERMTQWELGKNECAASTHH